MIRLYFQYHSIDIHDGMIHYYHYHYKTTNRLWPENTNACIGGFFFSFYLKQNSLTRYTNRTYCLYD